MAVFSKSPSKIVIKNFLFFSVCGLLIFTYLLFLSAISLEYLDNYNNIYIFILTNITISALTMAIFYTKYGDFLAPHIIIPLEYLILVISTVFLKDTFVPSIFNKICYAVTLGLLSFCIGGFITLIGVRFKADKNVQKDISFRKLKILSIILWLSAVLPILYMFIFAGIPLLAANSQTARFDFQKEVGGYIYILFISMIPASMLLVLLYNLGKLSRIALYLLVFIGFLLYVLIGFRSRILYTMISIYICTHYYRLIYFEKKISFFKTAVKGFIILVIFAIIFSTVGYYRLKTEGQLNANLPKNLSVSKIALYMIEQYVRALTLTMGRTFVLTEKEGFLGGNSYVNTLISPLPGISPKLLDDYLKDKFFPKGFSGGGTPPTVIGEAYINFGFIGVSITMLIVGVFLGAMHRNLLIQRKLSLLIIFCYFYQFFLVAGLFGGLLLFFQYVFAAATVVLIVIFSKSKTIIVET